MNSLGAAILWWANHIVNYICDVLYWMGRGDGFGRKDIDGLWRDDLGKLCHM